MLNKNVLFQSTKSIDLKIIGADRYTLQTVNFCFKNYYKTTLIRFDTNHILYQAFTNSDDTFLIRCNGIMKNPVVFDIFFTLQGRLDRIEADNGTIKGQIFPITMFNPKIE
ncbi:MAG: hypothetical protein HPY53_16055 [Brevinematales bacterium]|nr:hypothetical protein [Brevinematales bacterium]